ncbi:MAG: undecaprenyldiphospho-muramoylpentapeptide beta-N-acetylglucosaminyltransferase [Rhodospirillales bacterium]
MTMPSTRLIALAAGGTAGHVFPAVALARELEARGYRLALVTDRRGGAISGLDNIDVHHVSAGGLAGKSLMRRAASVAELGFGVLQARGILKRLRPDAVIGFGGYASVPPMIAASLLKTRTAIHEQNAVLGRANRLLAGSVDRIALSFENSRELPEGVIGKTVHTGMPVRPEIAALGAMLRRSSEDGRVSILVTGGSQGASILSEVVPAAVAALDAADQSRLRIVQQCRSEDLEAVRSTYVRLAADVQLASFFDDMPDRIAEADLMICRSGASSVAEALAAGRPAILVPYPYAIDDHQSANAHAVAEAGAGWLMDQSIFTADRLAERLRAFLTTPRLIETAANAARRAGRADAAARLANMVEDLVNGDTGGDRRTAA